MASNGLKIVQGNTCQVLKLKSKFMTYSSLALISNKQKKKDNSSQDFYKVTLASERILCGALCILAKDGIKWLENEE